MIRTPLSVVIITKDEETNIARCLESLRWADEVLVVDSGSGDRTVEICRGFPCRVIQTAWRGFGATKRYAVEQASHDWVLSVDADEAATSELAESIVSLLTHGPGCRGYRVRRRSFYLGREIRFSGWQRDCPVRLFDRRVATLNERPVHEGFSIVGTVGRVRGALLHFSYPTIAVHLAKMERYADLGAQALLERGRSTTIGEAIGRGMAKFAKMFLFRGGFLDGKVGFVLAVNSSYGVYLKYVKLWELSRRPRST